MKPHSTTHQLSTAMKLILPTQALVFIVASIFLLSTSARAQTQFQGMFDGKGDLAVQRKMEKPVVTIERVQENVVVDEVKSE